MVTHHEAAPQIHLDMVLTSSQRQYGPRWKRTKDSCERPGKSGLPRVIGACYKKTPQMMR
jgi:hypothetical protein